MAENRNKKDAERICAKIISTWRATNDKIIHIYHSSKNLKSKLYPATESFKLNPLYTPMSGETVLTKSVIVALLELSLKKYLMI